MDKIIFKYALPFIAGSVQDLFLPKGAEVLTVQIQKDNPVLWALVQEEAPTEKRTFVFFGTGEVVTSPYSEELVYVATIQQGALVFHVF